MIAHIPKNYDSTYYSNVKDKQMTPKEYKNKMMVKVVGSTNNREEDDEEIDEMIGGIFEVKELDYDNQMIRVFNKDKSDWLDFNLSDVQIATPVMYEGVNVCILDKVKCYGEWFEVFDFEWWQGEYRVLCDFANTRVFSESEIHALDQLYKEVKEELAVGSEMKLETEGGRIIKVKVIE
jgi:hypothetical protein